jgi:hypothetical protein
MQPTADRLASELIHHSGVVAVVMTGSASTGQIDEASDLDINVYVERERPASAVRQRIYGDLAVEGTVSVDDEIWGRHDDFRMPTGLLLDVAWWTVNWFEDRVRETVDECRALPGYSTVWWHQLLNAAPLADPTSWFSTLRKRYDVAYPDPLRDRIIALNLRAMRGHSFSYLHQLELATRRHDAVSLNHRVAAFLASYFDALLALNQVTHPGEKGLIPYARERCALLPDGFPQGVEDLVRALEPSEVVERARGLADTFADLVRAHGIRNQI